MQHNDYIIVLISRNKGLYVNIISSPQNYVALGGIIFIHAAIHVADINFAEKENDLY
jgi:hypothetical protein